MAPSMSTIHVAINLDTTIISTMPNEGAVAVAAAEVVTVVVAAAAEVEVEVVTVVVVVVAAAAIDSAINEATKEVAAEAAAAETMAEPVVVLIIARNRISIIIVNKRHQLTTLNLGKTMKLITLITIAAHQMKFQIVDADERPKIIHNKVCALYCSLLFNRYLSQGPII